MVDVWTIEATVRADDEASVRAANEMRKTMAAFVKELNSLQTRAPDKPSLRLKFSS